MLNSKSTSLNFHQSNVQLKPLALLSTAAIVQDRFRLLEELCKPPEPCKTFS